MNTSRSKSRNEQERLHDDFVGFAKETDRQDPRWPASAFVQPRSCESEFIKEVGIRKGSCAREIDESGTENSFGKKAAA